MNGAQISIDNAGLLINIPDLAGVTLGTYEFTVSA